MFEGKLQRLKIAMLAAGMITSSPAAEFVVPAEGPVAFRRDRVPLDSEMMGELSLQLTDMAYGLTAATAAELRGAAQMLALATTLDPGNTRARGLIEDFRRNRRRPNPDVEKLASDRARVWQTIAWLETPEAGPDGQALATCLKDVMTFSDPKDPRSEAILAEGQRGAWNGWIPPLASYEGASAGGDGGTEGTKGATGSLVARKEATVSTVLWQPPVEAPGAKWTQSLVALTMAAEVTTGRSSADFAVSIGGADETTALSSVAVEVTALLKSVHGTLPEGVRVSITGPGLAAAEKSGKPLDIQAAAAVLANAAVTGKEPEATVLGTVDKSGNYTVSPGFWSQLREVEKGKGGRLILPAAAADYLTAILAFEKPQFFLKNEVLLAKDFKQALELSAKTPDEAYAAPLGQFAEIQAKANPQSVGPYLTNSFVRRRLAEIAQAAPFHYSAKMLLIQGSGNRPTLVPHAVMVSEIRSAVEPLVEIAQNVMASTALGDNLGTAYETCRTTLDGLQRYAEKDDRALLSQAQEVLTSVRTLDRANRTKTSAYDTSALYEARTEFLRLFTTFATQLEANGASPLLPR